MKKTQKTAIRLKRHSLSRSQSWALNALVIALLLFPFIVLMAYSASWKLRFSEELMEVAAFTFIQAALSAVFSLGFGILGSFGLLWFANRPVSSGLMSHNRGKLLSLLEALVLLPNLTPVLLLLLAVMKFFPYATGIVGITLTHTLLNAGLISVSFFHLLQEKVAGMAELAWVEGAKGTKFFFRGVLPFLKPEIGLLFLFVFALCFTSFAVPLVIGGTQATTIEVLIYQKIRISGDWGEAIGLASLQMLAVFLLSWVLRRDPATSLEKRPHAVPLLNWKWGLGFALFSPAVLLIGLVSDLTLGLNRVLNLPVLLDELPKLVVGSFLVGIGSGGSVMLFLLLLAYLNPQDWMRRLLLGYVAPSSVLIGFALLVLYPATGWITYLKIIVGLTLISVPSFYRLRWDALLQSLAGQRQVALTLGADNALIFARVVFPQVLKPACFIGGVSSLWAWGDFALSAVVAERTLTVAMLIQSLMASYRLDAATFLIWIVIIGGGLTFALFQGVGIVFGAKSET